MRDRLEALVSVATIVVSVLVAVQLVDTVTGGALRRAARLEVARSRARILPRAPMPSPRDVSEVLSEAVRITREAATSHE